MRVFPVYYILETLSYKGPSYYVISLGNSIYILVYEVAKGTLVRRDYFLN